MNKKKFSFKYDYNFVQCCSNCNIWEFKDKDGELEMYCEIQKSFVSELCKCKKWKNRV